MSSGRGSTAWTLAKPPVATSARSACTTCPVAVVTVTPSASIVSVCTGSRRTVAPWRSAAAVWAATIRRGLICPAVCVSKTPSASAPKARYGNRAASAAPARRSNDTPSASPTRPYAAATPSGDSLARRGDAPRRVHRDAQHPDRLVEGDTALRLDLGVARDGALGQSRPDRVAVEDAIDPPLVVVAAEDVVVVGAHGRLVRPDQHHPVGLSRQMPRGGRADQSLADHHDAGPLR